MSEQPPPVRTRKRTIEPVAPETPKPWLPPACDPTDIYALQAVYNGRATEDQQRRCMDFVIKELCGVNRNAFVPGDGDATNLALGKQWVGQTLASLLTVRIKVSGEQS